MECSKIISSCTCSQVIYNLTRGPMHEVHARAQLCPEGHADGCSAIQSNQHVSCIIQDCWSSGMNKIICLYKFLPYDPDLCTITRENMKVFPNKGGGMAWVSTNVGKDACFQQEMTFVFKNPVTGLEHYKCHGNKYQRMSLMKSNSVLHAFEELIFTPLF